MLDDAVEEEEPAPVPSYERINYDLRPAKNMERKMMVELLRRLDRVSSLRHYRYVGFGSPYFADFSLVHRALAIKDMVSIERNLQHAKRFQFNCPFAAIALSFGDSGTVLPQLTWEQRSIVWLDYDYPLVPAMLVDVMTVVSQAASGTVLVITVDAEPDDMIDGRADRLRHAIPGLIPIDINDDLLGGWGTADVYRRIIDEAIRNGCTDRNAGLTEAAQIHYHQFFNFNYRDGARMLTVGGMLFDAGLEHQVNGLGLTDFDFYMPGEEGYFIPVPKLTTKEMRHFDAQLPCVDIAGIDAVGVSEEDVGDYGRVYRYFPHFVDADL